MKSAIFIADSNLLTAVLATGTLSLLSDTKGIGDQLEASKSLE